MNTLEHILEHKDIKPTAIRKLVLRTLLEHNCALSIGELETIIGTVDKSTIFRTITLFLAHHLVHSIEDGSGQTKYAVCETNCHCDDASGHGFSDLHTHFSCERCHRTFCLRGLPVPRPELPEGFSLNSANYVLFGLCPDCQKAKS